MTEATKNCTKCSKPFVPKYGYEKKCFPCWKADDDAGPKEELRTATSETASHKDDTMCRMAAIKDALAYLELECITQQRKTLTKDDMYALAAEIHQYILTGKKL